MKITDARQQVIDAGHRLVAEGLVARTWGNISRKTDENHFVITPSGRSYDELTPADIVEVQTDNCKWSGSVKPSSEKGIHAGVYRLRSDIQAVIHTHQVNASVVAAARRDLLLSECPFLTEAEKAFFGGDILCARYGLPGTGPLRKATTGALAKSGGKAVLMANHGALCLGTTMDEAFEIARQLEDLCQRFIFEAFRRQTGRRVTTVEELHAAFSAALGGRS